MSQDPTADPPSSTDPTAPLSGSEPPAGMQPPPPPPAATPGSSSSPWGAPAESDPFATRPVEAPAPPPARPGDAPTYGGAAAPSYGATPPPPPQMPGAYGQPGGGYVPPPGGYAQPGGGAYGAPGPYAAPGVPAAYGAYSGVEHPQGTLILILGILSIVICGLTGPFAWSMGRKALREIDTSGMAYSNRGQVQAGMITGIIGSVFLLLAILYIIFVVFIIGMAATQSSVR